MVVYWGGRVVCWYGSTAVIMRNLVSALRPRQHCKMCSTAAMTVGRFNIITAEKCGTVVGWWRGMVV